MKVETMYKELYDYRFLLFSEYNNIQEATLECLDKDFDGDLEEYFDYLNRLNENYKNHIEYCLKILTNDCKLLRKIFIVEKLKEVDSKNKIICLYTLYNIMDKIDYVSLFVKLLDNSSYFDHTNYSLSKYETFQEVKSIKEINELKKYIIDKMNMNDYLRRFRNEKK